MKLSYEGAMLARLGMPARERVADILLKALFQHGGVIKEFGAGQEIVNELADKCGLNEIQRKSFLETVYRKENRKKKSFLWHRLLFRAADALAKESLVTRPMETARLTDRREWMLTERGFDKAMRLCDIPAERKGELPIKSYEVEKIVKKLFNSPAAQNYNPFDTSKKIVKTTKETVLRMRGFRQAVIKAYGFRCAVCQLQIKTPDALSWEVQAAHIVPNHSRGRDDICNGIALCHLHHWAFDVGWFTVLDDYKIQVSPKIHDVPTGHGKLGDYGFFPAISSGRVKISLPEQDGFQPHPNAMCWHRQNIFHR